MTSFTMIVARIWALIFLFAPPTTAFVLALLGSPLPRLVAFTAAVTIITVIIQAPLQSLQSTRSRHGFALSNFYLTLLVGASLYSSLAEFSAADLLVSAPYWLGGALVIFWVISVVLSIVLSGLGLSADRRGSLASISDPRAVLAYWTISMVSGCLCSRPPDLETGLEADPAITAASSIIAAPTITAAPTLSVPITARTPPPACRHASQDNSVSLPTYAEAMVKATF
ncbi:hypothetical protein GALMADRAFT_142449 [Galerina marginata CBS 339.88]|uniref:Uncharacterized protein n=1 Tax=Galerina marginata (strain CBS 339.88) TaxID=685588 RepID=A0A067SR15_GALM3|nr:hypothetical protein GALMADRAFT_142449 [Galerina marginata CBS 339.88]